MHRRPMRDRLRDLRQIEAIWISRTCVAWRESRAPSVNNRRRWSHALAGVTLPYGGCNGLNRGFDGLVRALNSAVECHLHTVEVVGSNPTAPTINP